MKVTLPRETTITRQFNGPANSGNGGYVAGILGTRLTDQLHCETAVTVNLRKPPPLDHPLRWVDGPHSVSLVDDDTLIGFAAPGEFDDGSDPIPPVDPALAREAQRNYAGFHNHPFPTCFTCGSERAEGDGLRVFSGPLPDGRVACPWTPHPAFDDGRGLLAPEFVWAALDCPGGWAGDIKGNPMVLARMTAYLYSRPRIGEECLVVGALRGVSGRKNYTATTIYGEDGDIVGRAEQIWVSIDIENFS